MAEDINALLKEEERLKKELNNLYAAGEGQSKEAGILKQSISDIENQISNFQNKQASREKTKQALFSATSWTGDALTKGIGSNFSQIMIGIILILAIITYFVTQSYIAIVGAIGLMIIFLILPKLLENPMIKTALIFGGIIAVILSLLFFKQFTIFVITIIALLIFFAPMLRSEGGKIIALSFILLMLIAAIALPQQTAQVLSKGITYTQEATTGDTSEVARKSIIDSVKEFFASFISEQEKQKQIIAGNYSEGNVQQSENPYGIKLMAPRIAVNPESTNQNQQTQIFASIYGFSTQTMNVDLTCYLEKVGKENSKITGNMITDKVTFDAGIRDIKDDPICQITPTETGLNEVTIVATANNIATSSELENYFIDKTTYLTMKRSYEDQKGIIIETNDEAISALFPGYPKPVSVSESGHLKLIISTTQNAIIPLSNNDKITTTIRFENTDSGLITGINYLKLEIPEGFKASSNCLASGWAQNGNQLTFTNLGSYDFTTIKKGMQNGVPSCQLEVVDATKILINPTKPNLVKFKSSISYNYQVEFKKEIRVIENQLPYYYNYAEGKIDQTLPHPENQQKILAKATEMGIPGSLALALSYHESAGTFNQFVTPNTNNPDSIDYGIMQVNNAAHCEYFLTADRPLTCGTIATICDAKNDVDCNILAGLTILKNAKNTCDAKGGTIQYCSGQYTYSDWDCALRVYNGWSSSASCDNPTYVEKVIESVAKFT